MGFSFSFLAWLEVFVALNHGLTGHTVSCYQHIFLILKQVYLYIKYMSFLIYLSAWELCLVFLYDWGSLSISVLHISVSYSNLSTFYPIHKHSLFHTSPLYLLCWRSEHSFPAWLLNCVHIPLCWRSGRSFPAWPWDCVHIPPCWRSGRSFPAWPWDCVPLRTWPAPAHPAAPAVHHSLSLVLNMGK